MGEKTFHVLQCLKTAEEPISGKSIREYLLERNIKVDIKTVYSLISRINTFYFSLTGVPYIKAMRRKGYFIQNSFFEDGELQFLIDSIVSNPNLCQEENDKLKEKLLLLSHNGQEKRLMLSEQKNGQADYSLLLNLSTLLNAIMHQETVYFTYVNYRVEKSTLMEVASTNGNLEIGDTSYYVVSPYRVVLRGSHYYLLGYFDAREGKLSMYRLDRMRLVRNHNSKFIDIREQFDVEKDLERNVNMFVSSEKIELHFKFQDSILREVVNQFGTNIKVTKVMDNWNLAIVKEVTMSEGLLGWIFMLQDKIEIILPIHVKEQVIQKIMAMSKLYTL